MTTLFRRMPAVTETSADDEKNKHLGWLMLTALGIGATIGAGIFVMPGRIALLAGPAGILSFAITGFVFLFVGICYYLGQTVLSGIAGIASVLLPYGNYKQGKVKKRVAT